MTVVVVDDHLLRDLLASGHPVTAGEIATTNLWYARLCRSAVSARGGALTGAWTVAQRRALGLVLVALPEVIEVVPLRTVAWRMAELAETHGLSSLGAEVIAAAEHLGGTVRVWAGDDGPRIRAAAAAEGIAYEAVERP